MRINHASLFWAALEIREQIGGGLRALGRHSVAALLNASSSEVSYDLSAGEVVDMFDQTHPGTKGAYNTLKDNFESFNEKGCPLN